jgi:hypothetical protein
MPALKCPLLLIKNPVPAESDNAFAVSPSANLGVVLVFNTNLVAKLPIAALPAQRLFASTHKEDKRTSVPDQEIKLSAPSHPLTPSITALELFSVTP